jgi:thiamine pyrophosphokinase
MNKLAQLIPEYLGHISICANGLFPTNAEVIALLKNGSPIIACDGALNAMSDHGIVADFAIGDGDSLDRGKLQDFAKNPYIQIADQNTNDLTKAINFIAENYGYNQSILIFAATGLREDHTLANIALLEQYSAQFKQIAMLSDFGILEALSAGKHKLNSIPGQQISFFCFNQKTEISCEELKWPLVNKNFLALNHGTLNQVNADHINVECNGSLVVFRAYEIKH